MKCPRCNKKVHRKIWKTHKHCYKCSYNGTIDIQKGIISDYAYKICIAQLYAFATNKYIVLVEKNLKSSIWIKKSDREKPAFSRNTDLRQYDTGDFICEINRPISRKATDEDIDMFLALK